MIEVRAPSRLHFGLLNASGVAFDSIDSDSRVIGRRFGGVGLLVDAPGMRLRVAPADEWSVHGPMADRALQFAKRFVSSMPPNAIAPQSIMIDQAPPEHCGLGAGTQLGLAVAKALALASGQAQLSSVELAEQVGRGLRSAIGIHGFDHGGLIVDGGKREPDSIGLLLHHETLPEEWRVVVVVPDCGAGLHGDAERFAFDRLVGAGESNLTETLCRIVLLGLLPAIRERDCRAFGEALYEFNARVGEQFRQAQGGRYASPICAKLIEFMRGLGCTGVGQSSWGPGLFAVLENEERACSLAHKIKAIQGVKVQLWVTRPSGGAIVTA